MWKDHSRFTSIDRVIRFNAWDSSFRSGGGALEGLGLGNAAPADWKRLGPSTTIQSRALTGPRRDSLNHGGSPLVFVPVRHAVAKINTGKTKEVAVRVKGPHAGNLALAPCVGPHVCPSLVLFGRWAAVLLAPPNPGCSMERLGEHGSWRVEVPTTRLAKLMMLRIW